MADTNGCDEATSELRCEEMLAAGAADALTALLACPGAAGAAEVAMTWLPRPFALEQSAAHAWLQASAPQDAQDALLGFQDAFMLRLATDCIEHDLRVSELVHTFHDDWAIAHDLGDGLGRYHKVRCATVNAANQFLHEHHIHVCGHRLCGTIRSIYYRLDKTTTLEADGVSCRLGAVAGTDGRILCFLLDDEEREHPMGYEFFKRESDGSVECLHESDRMRLHEAVG